MRQLLPRRHRLQTVGIDERHPNSMLSRADARAVTIAVMQKSRRLVLTIAMASMPPEVCQGPLGSERRLRDVPGRRWANCDYLGFAGGRLCRRVDGHRNGK
jgi:hypothetical protein